MKEFIEELYQPNEITKDLITNEDEINKVKESEKTNWDYVFTDSAEDQEVDQEIRYRMRDVDTPATYETEVDYYDPTTIQIETEIKGQKKWINDIVEKRPDSIKVFLLANGKKVKEQSVTSRTSWTYRFTNIPVYDALGEKIAYTIKEKAVAGYETIYDRFDIINEPVDSIKEINEEEEENNLATSPAIRIGLFVLGAAAIAAGLLLDQGRKKE